MTTISHGKWLPYVPQALPPGMLPTAIYAHREGDQVDWYAYVYTIKGFAEHTVKGAALWQEERQAYIVGPATYDASEIFPANQLVFEVTDYTGSDPFADFSGKVYHPEDGTFTDYPAPPLARIAKLENSGGD